MNIRQFCQPTHISKSFYERQQHHLTKQLTIYGSRWVFDAFGLESDINDYVYPRLFKIWNISFIALKIRTKRASFAAPPRVNSVKLHVNKRKTIAINEMRDEYDGI